jgi:hypothetical protein
MASVGRARVVTALPTTLIVCPDQNLRKSACRQRRLPPSIAGQG